jgi:hypothetical protein
MEDNLISEELINDKKARINELRDSINNIRSLGFQPPHDMTFELAELENSVLINSELIPTLIGVLEQEFSKFTSEINLLLNYSPDSGLNISLCNDRKQNNRSKRLKIKVVYSNGGTIKCQFGGDTIVEFIREVGVERVEKLNIRTGKVDGNRLIIKEEIFRDIDESVRKSCAYKSAGKGYYVHTSLTTSRKVEIIKTIIEKLGIDADVFAE